MIEGRKRDAEMILRQIGQSILVTNGNHGGALSRLRELLDGVENETIAPEDAMNLAQELQDQYST